MLIKWLRFSLFYKHTSYFKQLLVFYSVHILRIRKFGDVLQNTKGSDQGRKSLFLLRGQNGRQIFNFSLCLCCSLSSPSLVSWNENNRKSKLKGCNLIPKHKINPVDMEKSVTSGRGLKYTEGGWKKKSHDGCVKHELPFWSII